MPSSITLDPESNELGSNISHAIGNALTDYVNENRR